MFSVCKCLKRISKKKKKIHIVKTEKQRKNKTNKKIFSKNPKFSLLCIFFYFKPFESREIIGINSNSNTNAEFFFI